MNVLMISPGYPTEINYFTRAWRCRGTGIRHRRSTGARLPDLVRRHLAGYLQVSSLLDEAAVVKQVQHWKAAQPLKQVECLWEPGVISPHACVTGSACPAGRRAGDAVP